jgi:hypothetical protein
VILLAGCGSKINEANYYRVQYGMDEAAVDELLGPARSEDTPPQPATQPDTQPATQPVSIAPVEGGHLPRKVKKWSREGLTFTVEFEGGKVVARHAEGFRR